MVSRLFTCGQKMCKLVIIIENESIGVIQKLIFFAVRFFCSALLLPGASCTSNAAISHGITQTITRPHVETAEMPKNRGSLN